MWRNTSYFWSSLVSGLVSLAAGCVPGHGIVAAQNTYILLLRCKYLHPESSLHLPSIGFMQHPDDAGQNGAD